MEHRVTLTIGEWGAAAAAGFERHLLAVVANSKADWQNGTELENHILGALGEAAWHKWRGLWWPAPLNIFNVADAEDILQIRTTPRRNPFFKVKPKDNPDFVAVFLIGGERVFDIVGCMSVREAQQRYALADPGQRGRPCHPIPREDMYPVERLAGILDARRAAQASGMVSRCRLHGDYPGEGECFMCALLDVA